MEIHVFSGMYSHGENPEFIVKDNRIYRFYDYISQNRPAYTISGNRIYAGVLTSTMPEFTMEGNKIYEGIPHGELPLFEIRGNMVYRIRGRVSGESPVYHLEEK